MRSSPSRRRGKRPWASAWSKGAEVVVGRGEGERPRAQRLPMMGYSTGAWCVVSSNDVKANGKVYSKVGKVGRRPLQCVRVWPPIN